MSQESRIRGKGVNEQEQGVERDNWEPDYKGHGQRIKRLIVNREKPQRSNTKDTLERLLR